MACHKTSIDMSESLLKIAVIDCSSTKVSEIIEMLETCGCLVSTVHLQLANATNFNQYDGVVISGGPKLFTDPDQKTVLAEQFKFITELTRPTLGICLGHQAIGLAYEAEVYRDSERRETELVEIKNNHPLFQGMPQKIKVGTDHCEGISLPKNFDLLASSSHYPVEAIAYEQKKLYGLQFHPEISGNFGKQIFKNFCRLILTRH